MVLLDSLLVRGVEDAPDLVFFLTEKDIVVRYPEFIWGGAFWASRSCCAVIGFI